MSTGDAGENKDILQENRVLREKCAQLAQNFNTVVTTFNKALVLKENQRLFLKNRIEDLLTQIKENYESLQIVGRNLEIYDQENRKVVTALSELADREGRVKEQYERLLEGTPVGALDMAAAGSRRSGGGDVLGVSAREHLARRRKEYLDGLDHLFKKLEDELAEIDNSRREFEQARLDISIKNEEAMETKSILEKDSRILLSSVREVEGKLEISIQEETALMNEFDRLMKDVEGSIQLSDDIDEKLFSLLAATEAGQGPAPSARPR